VEELVQTDNRVPYLIARHEAQDTRLASLIQTEMIISKIRGIENVMVANQLHWNLKSVCPCTTYIETENMDGVDGSSAT
jgi:hypothetical protein